MKRKEFCTFRRRLLRGAVAGVMTFAMVLGLVPGISVPITAKANDNPAVTKTITGLGTGAIGDPHAPEDANSNWTGSYVYYGKYDNQTLKYRVLDANTDRFGGTNMLLDCDSILYTAPFDDNGSNTWAETSIRNGLNAGENSFYATSFSAPERNAIAASTIAEHHLSQTGEGVNVSYVADAWFKKYVPLSNEKIFLLDAEDVSNVAYGYVTDDGCWKCREKTGVKKWWLRSAGGCVGNYAGAIDRGGIDGSPTNYEKGVSPAFNVKLTPVIFSSFVTTDSSYGSTPPSAGDDGACYKLTLLDENIGFSVTEGDEVVRYGNVVTVPYTISGTDRENVNRLSVLILNQEYVAGKVVTEGTNEAGVPNYTYLRMDTTQSGIGKFELPDNYANLTWGTDYFVYILAEDVNGSMETDYASAPVALSKPTITADAEDVTVTYDGNPHGISVSVSDLISGATIKYGTSENNCTLTSSPSITNVSDSPKTVYYEITADGYGKKKGSATITINPAEVAVTGGITATDKPYDETDTAILDCSNAMLTGVKGNDDVTVTSAKGTFANATIGEWTVNIDPTTIKLGGAKKGNYKVATTGNQATTTATIQQATTVKNAPKDNLSVAYLTDKVGDVTLPAGWNWNEDDEDVVLEVGVPKTVTALYNGADKGNYTDAACSKTVTVTRSACKHPETKIINKVVPKEDKEGYSGDTYCTDCKTVIKKGHVEEKTYKPVTVNYVTHIQNVGWEKTAKKNGETSGTTGSSLRLEGIRIKVTGNENLGIRYTTHCQDYGWLAWSRDGEMSGTEGESKRLEAIMINLTGADKDKYDVYYRVHAQNVGWMNWAKNGEAAGTAGYGYRLEALQIEVVKKGEKPVNVGKITTNSTKNYEDKNKQAAPKVDGSEVPNVSYRTHVQNVGWQAWKVNGGFAGTSGRSLRLEGINIKLTNKDHTGGIRYKTHIQNLGWEKTWRTDGEMSGTSGRSLRLEAIDLELYGDMAEYYDIYYRVHAQDVGWMGWAANGADAGTAGYARRLEGIQVVLVAKGAAAPAANYGGITSVTAQPFLQR